MSEEAKHKQSISRLGTKIVNKNGKEKRINKEELEEYLSDGWLLGFTEEHKRKNGEVHKKNK